MAKKKTTKKKKAKKTRYQKCAEEMNEVMGLKPPIDVSLDEDDLIEKIKQEADEVEEGDEFTEATCDTLKEIGVDLEAEEEEEEDDEESDDEEENEEESEDEEEDDEDGEEDDEELDEDDEDENDEEEEEDEEVTEKKTSKKKTAKKEKKPAKKAKKEKKAPVKEKKAKKEKKPAKKKVTKPTKKKKEKKATAEKDQYGFRKGSRASNFALAITKKGMTMAEIKEADWNTKNRSCYGTWNKIKAMGIGKLTKDGKMKIVKKK